MKLINISIFLGIIFVYVYYTLKYNFQVFGKRYNIQKRKSSFEKIAKSSDCIFYSCEISQLIPIEIFKKTIWFKKYGYGWFDFVVKILCNKLLDVYICDFGILRNPPGKTGLLDIHITILIIIEKEIISANIQKRILSKKFYSIYKKISEPKIETVENYVFIWFDAPLNLESLKLLKEITENNQEN